MRRRAILAGLLALMPPIAAAAPAHAQGVVESRRPDSVDVTVYRDPGRGAGEAFNLRWLEGYALISETRRISLPAGESEIRFEGVAAGMIPQSAIVSGLPEGIVEQNRDAYLLSPATLVDRSFGRRVTLRRTSLATGTVRETEAVIRTGAEGAVVLETPEGFEALRCTGLPETLLYDEVPAGLSARPTFSVRARASRPLSATVTLSYLASGFDWQANYIFTLSEDGTRADLFAWLTLASNDETSFPDADAQAVAGQINRNAVRPQSVEGPPLQLRCWPRGTTSDIPLEGFLRTPPASPPAVVVQDEEFIVVTGTRVTQRNLTSAAPVPVVEAQQEELGAVKLYRIPEPVTIAANAQKQVALLRRSGVRVEIVYRDRFGGASSGGGARPAARFLVTRNRADEGLGLPLPAGPVAMFAEHDGRPFLIGEAILADRAIGEDVEVDFGAAPGVTSALRLVRTEARAAHYELTVSSDRPHPVAYEAELDFEQSAIRTCERLGRRDGRPLWRVGGPANGTRTLRFRIARPRP